jgi:CubicO group peptidase (beta-lactamase class C family)
MDPELEALVAAALDEHDTAGCAIGFAHGGRTWTRGFGRANIETGVPFGGGTSVPIASMTKPYTATAVMALVQAGRLDLGDPVRRWLPEFAVDDPGASARVTVRQLLHHTAGWAGDLGLDSTDRGDAALAGEVAAMRSVAQVTPVGEQWSYSNSAYMVAGRLVEAVCGTSFEDAVQRLVLDPLGLTRTVFFAERAIGRPVAIAHAVGESGELEVVHEPWGCPRCIHPAGGLISTAEDQLRWLRWWAGDLDDVPGPLSPSTRARMLDERIPAGSIADAMGVGWMIDEIEGIEVVHHSGSLNGMQTHGLFVRGHRLALVVLANGRGGIQVQKRVREHVLDRALGLRPPRYEPIDASPETLAELSGAYRVASSRDGATIVVRRARAGLEVRLPADGGAEPQTFDTRLYADDALVIVGGPLDGLRAELVRDGDGAVMALRFWARLHPRVA